MCVWSLACTSHNLHNNNKKPNKWYSNSPRRSIRELRSQGKSHACHWRHKGSTEEYLMAVNG